ncbi:UNVERIFIED_CONTAM: hypothetical protein GTU68_065562 [Idotea baltica]|nr:hypothetical protein [Idotea baltica]
MSSTWERPYASS